MDDIEIRAELEALKTKIANLENFLMSQNEMNDAIIKAIEDLKKIILKK